MTKATKLHKAFVSWSIVSARWLPTIPVAVVDATLQTEVEWQLLLQRSFDARYINVLREGAHRHD